jgi:hypothetical protein
MKKKIAALLAFLGFAMYKNMGTMLVGLDQ